MTLQEDDGPEEFPFLFFGQGSAESGSVQAAKGLECFVWFSGVPTEDTRAHLVQSLPAEMRFYEKWTERTLWFGSDDALQPDRVQLCSELEAWARAAHPQSGLVAFGKLDRGQGTWHRWSCTMLRERFTGLPWAALASDAGALGVTSPMVSRAVPDVEVARSMPPTQRLAMWRWIAQFDTSPRRGTYHPLAYRLAWLAESEQLSEAEIDRLVCDAGLNAVEAVGRERALAACLALQASDGVGPLDQALRRTWGFSRAFHEDWPAVEALLEALANNRKLAEAVETAERTVFERCCRGEAPGITSPSSMCAALATNGMHHRKFEPALRWLRLALRFPHPPPRAFADHLHASRELGRGSAALAELQADARYAQVSNLPIVAAARESILGKGS